MCFDWCFGTRVLPSYRDSNMPAVRDCVARKRSYTVTRFKARQFLFTRTPDPLRTRSVRRASDSVHTALSESGVPRPRLVRHCPTTPHIGNCSVECSLASAMKGSAHNATPKSTAGFHGAKSWLYRPHFGEVAWLGLPVCFEPTNASQREVGV